MSPSRSSPTLASRASPHAGPGGHACFSTSSSGHGTPAQERPTCGLPTPSRPPAPLSARTQQLCTHRNPTSPAASPTERFWRSRSQARGSRVEVAWVGGARAVLVRGHTAEAFTRPHPLLEQVLEVGLDPRSNASWPIDILRRTIGPGDTNDAGPDYARFEFRAGDTLVLLSNSGMQKPPVSLNTIADMVALEPDVDAAASAVTSAEYANSTPSIAASRYYAQKGDSDARRRHRRRDPNRPPVDERLGVPAPHRIASHRIASHRIDDALPASSSQVRSRPSAGDGGSRWR